MTSALGGSVVVECWRTASSKMAAAKSRARALSLVLLPRRICGYVEQRCPEHCVRTNSNCSSFCLLQLVLGAARHFTTLASSSVSFLAFRARTAPNRGRGPAETSWPGLLARANDVATPFPQHSWACHPLRRQAKRGPVAKGDRSARRTGSPTRARAARNDRYGCIGSGSCKTTGGPRRRHARPSMMSWGLYGKAASPDVQIPKAAPGTTMAVAPEYVLGPPSDPVVQETINYVGPKDHFPSLDKKYDLVVVGAGVAGLLSVITAKALGKKALLIEKHYMGGDCLNVGCVPSKCLVAAAKALQSCRKAASLGVVGAETCRSTSRA